MAQPQKRLLICLAAQAVLGSLMLGMGQGEYHLPLLTLLVVLIAVQVTDLRGTFYLSRRVANLAALVAVGLSALDFARLRREDQLFAIANLLVYLQAVVFFQRKTPRACWQLTVLSLLQVVVGAALSYSLFFGFLLVVHLTLATFVLIQLFLYRENLAFEMRRASWRQPVGRTERADESTDWRGLWAVTRRVVAWTLVVAMLAFFSVPRLAKPESSGFGVDMQRMVGFSSSVELGELGETVQNPETVMQLKLLDAAGKSFKLEGELYLRGSVLTTYQTRDAAGSAGSSHWLQPHGEARIDPRGVVFAEDKAGMTVQQISLEPLDEPVVFGIYPIFTFDEDVPLRFDAAHQQLVRWPIEAQQSRMELELATSGIHGKRQRPVVPEFSHISRGDRRGLLQMPAATDGRDPLAALRAFADEAVDAKGIPADEPLRVAQALETRLRGGGDFQYSLAGTQRDVTLDPVEDFISKSRKGHCEYFASALTLMLRGRGIPARMVIGYKGGEWNDLGDFYQIRQLHAHAWVEAYLTKDELAGASVDLRGAPGGWVRLDPTSMTSLETRGVVARAGQFFDALQMIWMRNVVGLTHQRQEQKIFEPLREIASEWMDALSRRMSWLGACKAWLSQVCETLKSWAGGSWLSWRGGAIGALALAALYGVRVAIKRLFFVARRWFRRRRTARLGVRLSQVEFYRRLEKTLRRLGQPRVPGQTPREYADQMGRRLAENPAFQAAAHVPSQIVEVFYQVRFGQRALDSQSLFEVEQALRQLDETLQTRPTPR